MGLYSAAQTARAHGGGLCLENTSRGGRGHPVDFYFIIFPQFPQKPLRFGKTFVLWSGHSPTQIPMRRRLTMP